MMRWLYERLKKMYEPEPAPVKDCLHKWHHRLQVERGCNRCHYALTCQALPDA